MSSKEQYRNAKFENRELSVAKAIAEVVGMTVVFSAVFFGLVF